MRASERAVLARYAARKNFTRERYPDSTSCGAYRFAAAVGTTDT